MLMNYEIESDYSNVRRGNTLSPSLFNYRYCSETYSGISWNFSSMIVSETHWSLMEMLKKEKKRGEKEKK